MKAFFSQKDGYKTAVEDEERKVGVTNRLNEDGRITYLKAEHPQKLCLMGWW
jgi:hypothetical protein